LSELEVKTERLAAVLSSKGLDAVLLNAQHNFAWLTGGGNNGVDQSRENGASWILVTRTGRRYVLASRIEIERIFTEEVSPSDFEMIEFGWQEEKASSTFVLQKSRLLLGEGAKIASEISLDSSVEPIENLIARCRISLTDGEIERYRYLGRDASNALDQVVSLVSPGDTEVEIAEKMRRELASAGMSSVVSLVAADDRIARFRHPTPSDGVFTKTLLIVTCAKRQGLIASLSRMICVGTVPDDLREKTMAAAYVNARILNATRPGATGSEIYRVATDAYAERGFANEINLHHQGGAIAYRTREWVAHPQSTERVGTNQAFAWNPSITGTKVEDTWVVTDGGIDPITASPRNPYLTSTVDGIEYLSPGIISI
jgi:antitoxin VapB